ncbi:double-headed protease inhibitor, submandibular gland [Elysia marginata]|uniref:Double-headed protease inhibitor, submandibular gland n=1 Tax=Elysia marginata TaxID=1093978 RepID=A0AAV4EW32_9GAST|nr:double-headed protease inhibitor, submandibular gland [Elysia marginata]
MQVSIIKTLAVTICLLVCPTLPTTEAASCDPSPKACTRHLAPVCATFKKTFGNRCTMESELCHLAKKGFHLTQTGEDNYQCCSDVEPLMYWPTCASDGKTYDNIWAMQNAACKNRDHLVEAPSSTCPDFPKDWGSSSSGGWGSV